VGTFGRPDGQREAARRPNQCGLNLDSLFVHTLAEAGVIYFASLARWLRRDYLSILRPSWVQ
jgi:hypothetical protein